MTGSLVLRQRFGYCRLGWRRRPQKIANVYAFLAGDEARYVNGAVIEVSGGMTV
jgi:3-oxoacyl-[acyl-carrier protein] reductase